MKHHLFALLLACICSLSLNAESITYRIVEYNADAGSFVLAASGMRPVGSYAIFENDFGATRGNRYNQIPRNKQATLWLEGWEGCVINSVTLSMCSNNSSGTAALVVTSGDETLYTMHALPFADPEWLGHWLSKDLQTYAEITKQMTNTVAVGEDGEVAITVKGGTPEGSVYLDAVTIDYTPSRTVATESPLGWVFEKLEAKGKLADGDVVMLYRSGDAAGDIDGMATTHYLDAIGLSFTTNVVEPFVEFFTLGATPDGHWTLTDQYGRTLGATAAQSLAWDAGVDTWDITLGYSGAAIASTNSKYGTLRYNAPAESYPRFWNYTSTSLPLPYIYRRVRQIQPILCSSLELPDDMTVDLSAQDTLILHPTFNPTNVTSRRLFWQSSNEAVATVQSGVVFLHSAGETTISATCIDWAPDDESLMPSALPEGMLSSIPPTAYVSITVTDAISALSTPVSAPVSSSVYLLDGKRCIAPPANGLYITPGRVHLRRQ